MRKIAEIIKNCQIMAKTMNLIKIGEKQQKWLKSLKLRKIAQQGLK